MTARAHSPLATELWYDGVDQKDGLSDFDADLDGYNSDQHGGTDCDDRASSFILVQLRFGMTGSIKIDCLMT